MIDVDFVVLKHIWWRSFSKYLGLFTFQQCVTVVIMNIVSAVYALSM